MEYEIFIKSWLERSEKIKRKVDKGDHFICLWVSFNGWMKLKFGENIKEFELINKVCQSNEFKIFFNEFKSN
jgi:hypothetical protein